MNQLVKVAEFFKKYKHQYYKKGEILVRADDDPSGIFYLVAGMVKEYKISQKGDELVVNVFKPFSFFPMSWALNDTKNEYFFEAMTDLELWRAPKNDVITFVKDNPDILYNLMSRVYKGLDGVLTRMTYLMSGGAYSRLITEILISAKRFGTTDKKTGNITCNVNEKDLAAQSGMTRETVSREIKLLKNKGLVVFDKHKLVVKDIRKLEEELAGGV